MTELERANHFYNFIGLLDNYLHFDETINNLYSHLGIETSLYDTRSPLVKDLEDLLTSIAVSMVPLDWENKSVINECVSLYEDFIFKYSLAKQANKNTIQLYLPKENDPVEFNLGKTLLDTAPTYYYLTSWVFFEIVKDALNNNLAHDIYFELGD